MMFLLHFLRPEDIFFDIGANVGSYSILSAVCKQSCTHSFEPVPETYALLESNKLINKETNWILVNTAVGDCEGELVFSADRDTMNSVVDTEYRGRKNYSTRYNFR